MSDEEAQLSLFGSITPAEPVVKERKKITPKPKDYSADHKAKNLDERPSKEVSEMTEQTKSIDFESMLTELEKVVGQLEGELKLEQALALFERGLQLSQDCEKFLKAAEQRIEILKRSPSGQVDTERFEEAEVLVQS